MATDHRDEVETEADTFASSLNLGNAANQFLSSLNSLFSPGGNPQDHSSGPTSTSSPTIRSNSEPSTPAPSRRPSLRWLPRSSASSSPVASQPPSPALKSLDEALHEPCISRPEPVHLPPSFAPNRILSRPPPLVQHLTRSSLPTASLTSPAEPKPPPAANLPPSRSSVDTLRRFSTISTSSSSAPPSPSAIDSPENTSSGWWWFSSNKDQVDPLLTQEDRADDAADEQAKLRKKYRSPKLPMVFCHGLLGFDSVTIGPSIAPLQVAHWRGIKTVLEANGAEVLITRVPATSSPIDRAKVLEKRISEVYPGRSVHLIGHSMGGLDCRYLTTHLTERTFKVVSVTTVATPHRGSSFADHFLELMGRDRLPQVLSLLDMLPNGGGDGKAFESLTVGSMKKFNENTPDVEGVKYFSWGAKYEPGLIDTWKYPHRIILEKEGPNDGLVSVESAKWGKYMGTLTDVNHLDLVGWINTARYKWAELTGREIKFRPATFYLGVADILAREVEGITEPDDPDGTLKVPRLDDPIPRRAASA